MFLGHFRKGARGAGVRRSNGTIKVKKLLARLEREDGAKNSKKAQENVECGSSYRRSSEESNKRWEEEDNERCI